MRKRIIWSAMALYCCGFWIDALIAQQPSGPIIVIRTCDGKDISGRSIDNKIYFGRGSTISAFPEPLEVLLSYHSSTPTSAYEDEIIARNLELLSTADIAQAELGAAVLTDIGLPVIGHLLKGYVDTDAHEPDYRYRLFDRIIPGHVDEADRTHGLVRYADGRSERLSLANVEIKLVDESGKTTSVQTSNIRRFAVMHDQITKTFDLQALHHCSYVGYLDVGVIVTPQSSLTADARGFVRLSFDEDGWAADPDGIADPLPGKRRLQEGFRWGSILGRVGPAGQRWLAGSHIEKSDLGDGRLYFVINDNEHWQNNIGSFRVDLTVENAFDVGEPN